MSSRFTCPVPRRLCRLALLAGALSGCGGPGRDAGGSENDSGPRPVPRFDDVTDTHHASDASKMRQTISSCRT